MELFIVFLHLVTVVVFYDGGQKMQTSQLIFKMNRQHSSMVEQCFCNAKVVGSNPTAGPVAVAQPEEHRVVIAGVVDSTSTGHL